MKTFSQFQESLASVQQSMLHGGGGMGTTNGSTERIASTKAAEKKKRPYQMDRMLDNRAKQEYERKQQRLRTALSQ